MAPRPFDAKLAWIVGERIRERREKLSMTQYDLGAAALLSGQSIVSQYERGMVVPSLTTLMDLAHALHCEARDLIPDVHAIHPWKCYGCSGTDFHFDTDGTVDCASCGADITPEGTRTP